VEQRLTTVESVLVGVVQIMAIGEKHKERLFIGGEEVEL
jgi:hypothetical protein